MSHFLLDQYPAGFALVTQFGEEHPEILPARRARATIDRVNQKIASPLEEKVFKKRFGRWYVHIPSLIAYLEHEDSLLKESA